MRKIILTVTLALFAIVCTNAQASFGVKAGVNFASIRGDNTDDISGRTSFAGGLYAELPMSGEFTFQPELLYSGQGAEFTGIEGDETFKLDYLNVPLMFKYYVSEGFNVQAGPQIGFLLSAKADEVNTYDFMTNIDFGLNFGLGYKLESGINIEARYNLGLSNIWETYYYGSDAIVNNKNGVWQITLGYTFN